MVVRKPTYKKWWLDLQEITKCKVLTENIRSKKNLVNLDHLLQVGEDAR